MDLRTGLSVLIAATAVVAAPCSLAAQGEPEAIRVFLDCQTHCDFDYLRRQITYVSWVRDRQDADLHLLITSQGTGGGGREYQLQFLGLRQFQDMNDNIRFATGQSDTDDEVRQSQAGRIALGLARYVARSGIAGRVRVTYDVPTGAAAGAQQQAHDPWNLWVFRISANGSLSGETQSSENSLSGSLRASRVSDTWKLRINAGARVSHSRYVLTDSTEYKSTNSRYNGSALLVRSLGGHWSFGMEQNAVRSTYDNYDFRLQVLPGIEFDLFPYKESSRRQLVFVYAAGISHANYTDTTVYDKLVETRPYQEFTISAEAVQPWGSLNGQIQLSSYLDDLARNRASIFGGLEIRLVRGLNLNVFGSYSRVRDQLSLPKSEASDEEILLQLKQLRTSYFYHGSIGLSYTFGSTFNNVVNPRFSGSGGGNCQCIGGNCFCQ